MKLPQKVASWLRNPETSLEIDQISYIESRICIQKKQVILIPDTMMIARIKSHLARNCTTRMPSAHSTEDNNLQVKKAHDLHSIIGSFSAPGAC